MSYSALVQALLCNLLLGTKEVLKIRGWGLNPHWAPRPRSVARQVSQHREVFFQPVPFLAVTAMMLQCTGHSFTSLIFKVQVTGCHYFGLLPLRPLLLLCQTQTLLLVSFMSFASLGVTRSDLRLAVRVYQVNARANPELPL